MQPIRTGEVNQLSASYRMTARVPQLHLRLRMAVVDQMRRNGEMTGAALAAARLSRFVGLWHMLARVTAYRLLRISCSQQLRSASRAWSTRHAAYLRSMVQLISRAGRRRGVVLLERQQLMFGVGWRAAGRVVQFARAKQADDDVAEIRTSACGLTGRPSSKVPQ